jgi:hypothetical protein
VSFLGEEGTPRQRARTRGGDCICVWSASSWGRMKPGRAHRAVRGEGGGELGQPEAKAQWGGRSAVGPGRRRRPKRGGGSGPAEDQGPGG